MDFDTPEVKAYLFELYTMTQGNKTTTVSMYDVGETLGLGKTEAGTLAEDLFIRGFAELKTLSGGIGITRQGMEALDVEITPEPGSETLHLGKGPVLEENGKKAVGTILHDIKSAIARTSSSYSQIEEIVMDIKTIEVQLLSPKPKTGIIREVLQSLQKNLAASGPEEITAHLTSMVAS